MYVKLVANDAIFFKKYVEVYIDFYGKSIFDIK
jgi:hypothetical protein